MFCGNCGTQNDDHAVFCQNCGARLDAGGQNQNQQYQQNQQWQQQPVQPDNYSYQSESSAPVVTPKKNIDMTGPSKDVKKAVNSVKFRTFIIHILIMKAIYPLNMHRWKRKNSAMKIFR